MTLFLTLLKLRVEVRSYKDPDNTFTTLSSILVLAPAGGFGQLIVNVLIRRRNKSAHVAAFNNREWRSGAEVEEFNHLRSKGNEIDNETLSDVDSLKVTYWCLLFCILILWLSQASKWPWLLKRSHATKRQPVLIETAFVAGVRHFYPSGFTIDLTVSSTWVERYYRGTILG